MNRRTVLGMIGTGLVSLAGCAENRTDSPTAGRSTSPTSTPDPTFEMLDSTCGEGTNDASVSTEERTVLVQGTIGGSNTCEIAKLTDLTLTDGHLEVIIAAEMPDTDDTPACGPCLTDIDYRLEVRLESVPDSVTVLHNSGGKQVSVLETTL